MLMDALSNVTHLVVKRAGVLLVILLLYPFVLALYCILGAIVYGAEFIDEVCDETRIEWKRRASRRKAQDNGEGETLAV